MARMRIPMDSSVLIRDQFKSFLLSKKAYGTADKTFATYEQHFSAISKHLDVNKPIDFLCKKDLQKMIADMRDTSLSSNTIRSYTATLKTFFTWCREEGIVDLDIPLYKAEETIKETYTDHELEIDVGQKEKALETLRSYWGGMVTLGADTFWELYNPANPDESPYGGTIVSSYCHAWSCGPAYFLRKYFL